jgi:hypothetical protein
MVSWASGRCLEKHSPTRASTAAGVIQQPTCSTAFPQSTQAKAKTILHDIWRAEAKEKPRKRSICSSKPLRIKPKSNGLFAKTPNRIARLLRRSSSSPTEYQNDTSNRVRRRRKIKAPNTGIDHNSNPDIWHRDTCKRALHIATNVGCKRSLRDIVASRGAAPQVVSVDRSCIDAKHRHLINSFWTGPVDLADRMWSQIGSLQT